MTTHPYAWQPLLDMDAGAWRTPPHLHPLGVADPVRHGRRVGHLGVMSLSGDKAKAN